VFGPLLTAGNIGSVRIIQQLLQGRPAAMPRLGFWLVDVRDLADLHIRAMLAPQAAGQRFIAAGEFLWMRDIARTLRAHLGSQAAKVPTRELPDVVVRLLLPFMPQLRPLAPLLGRRFGIASQKAHNVLGFSPRPATTTLVGCARSLIA
jgi:nucleoside-diphosphate-sugar epimerase